MDREYEDDDDTIVIDMNQDGNGDRSNDKMDIDTPCPYKEDTSNSNDILKKLMLKYNSCINDNKPEPLEFINNIEFHDDDNHNGHVVDYITISNTFVNDNTANKSITLKELHNQLHHPLKNIKKYIKNTDDKQALLRYLQIQILIRLKCLAQIGKSLPSKKLSKKTNALDEICKLLSLLPLYILQPGDDIKEIFQEWIQPFHSLLPRLVDKIYTNFEINIPSEEITKSNLKSLVRKSNPAHDKLLRSISLPLPDIITLPIPEEKPELKRTTSLPNKKPRILQCKTSNPFLNNSTSKYVGNHFTSRSSSFVFHSASKKRVPKPQAKLERRKSCDTKSDSKKPKSQKRLFLDSPESQKESKDLVAQAALAAKKFLFK